MANRYDFGPGLGTALSQAWDSAENAYDRQVNRRRQKEQDAQNKERFEREKEQHDWEVGQRPLIAHQRGLQAQGQEIQNQTAQLGLEGAQQKQEDDKIRRAREGVRIAFPLIEKGDTRRAIEAWNKIMPDDPVKTISPKEGADGVFVVVQEDGDVVEISKDELRSMLADPISDKDDRRSANSEYLDFVARNVFGGDHKAAFEALNSSKGKSLREMVGAIMAANPYMTTEEAMKKAKFLQELTVDDAETPAAGGADADSPAAKIGTGAAADVGMASPPAAQGGRFGLWDGVEGVSTIVRSGILNPWSDFGPNAMLFGRGGDESDAPPSIPRPRTREEYVELPSGTRFIDPHGIERVKP